MLHAVRVFSRRPGSRLGTITLLGVALSQIPLWYATGSARLLALWLVAIGLSAVCAWRVPPSQRWLVGLGSLVSFLSVLFISMSTRQISGWWFVLIPLLGVVLVKLYLALSKRAVPLPAAGALPDQALLPKPGIARWWRGLVALLIPLHALGLGLYWAYTDHACSQYDLVRRVQGCTLVRTPPTFPANTLAVQISPSGALATSAAVDLTHPEQIKTEGATISLWDLKNGRLLRTLDQRAQLFGVHFSADDRLVATGGTDGQVRVWRVDDGSLLHTIPNAGNMIFSPDGSILATPSDETNIDLWSMQDGTLLRTITLDEDVVTRVNMMFSPDGSLLAVREFEDVTLWRVADGTLHQTIVTDQFSFDSERLSFSPDGQILVTTGAESGTEQHTMRIWRIADGTLVHSLHVNQEPLAELSFTSVGPIAFSPDGTHIAAGSFTTEEGTKPKMTILIWRVADGTLLERIEPNSLPNMLLFNGDNTVLQIYDSNNETVRVYDQLLTQPAAQ
ncbi:MAG: hypothetical protein JOZ51_22165 [Chloroflexi bacterium]|nr:hypothetical protein [Chloroflexota bacterium]